MTACPRCGAPLQPAQDWCLACGRAATTTIAAPPNWRVPVLLVVLAVLIAGAGTALAFVALAN